MKAYEREAFIKTFGIFFLSLALFATLLAFLYDKEQKHIMDEQILSQMLSFSYHFKEEGTFDVDIVPSEEGFDELNLQPCDEGMCGYFRIESAPQMLFKISIDLQRYNQALWSVRAKVLWLYATILIALLIFSFGYAFYALYPLKKALHTMEEFLKDVVHDLNTPITAITLNAKALLKKAPFEEAQRIVLGARSIAGIHHNLQFLHRTFEPYYERIELESFLHVRVQAFEKLYPSLTFHYETIPTHVYADSDALVRILDNLLSNACKYNHKKGHVTLHVSAMSLCIEDTGIGIEHPEKVFERYYKESSRGLGLGLHIVKTLCDAQGIQLALESQKGVGTRVWLTFTKEKA